MAEDITLGQLTHTVSNQPIGMADNGDGTFSMKVQQSGSIVAVNSDGSVLDTDVKEYRCVSTDTKIDASTVPKYSTLIEMDTNNIYYSNGSSWVVY